MISPLGREEKWVVFFPKGGEDIEYKDGEGEEGGIETT